MSTEKWKQEHVEEMRKYRRDYYYRNKQDHLDRNKKSWDKIKKFISELKITLKCSRCSERATPGVWIFIMKTQKRRQWLSPGFIGWAGR